MVDVDTKYEPTFVFTVVSLVKKFPSDVHVMIALIGWLLPSPYFKLQFLLICVELTVVELQVGGPSVEDKLNG